jgi:hypothetical protein
LRLSCKGTVINGVVCQPAGKVHDANDSLFGASENVQSTVEYAQSKLPLELPGSQCLVGVFGIVESIPSSLLHQLPIVLTSFWWNN